MKKEISIGNENGLNGFGFLRKHKMENVLNFVYRNFENAVNERKKFDNRRTNIFFVSHPGEEMLFHIEKGDRVFEDMVGISIYPEPDVVYDGNITKVMKAYVTNLGVKDLDNDEIFLCANTKKPFTFKQVKGLSAITSPKMLGLDIVKQFENTVTHMHKQGVALKAKANDYPKEKLAEIRKSLAQQLNVTEERLIEIYLELNNESSDGEEYSLGKETVENFDDIMHSDEEEEDEGIYKNGELVIPNELLVTMQGLLDKDLCKNLLDYNYQKTYTDKRIELSRNLSGSSASFRIREMEEARIFFETFDIEYEGTMFDTVTACVIIGMTLDYYNRDYVVMKKRGDQSDE